MCQPAQSCRKLSVTIPMCHMGIVIKFEKVLQLNQMSLKFNVKLSFDLEIVIAAHVQVCCA